MTDLSTTAAIELIDAAGISLGITPAAAQGDRLTADVCPDAVDRAVRIRVLDAEGVVLADCPSRSGVEALATLLREHFENAT